MIVPAALAAQLALKTVAAAPNAVQAIAEILTVVQCEGTKRRLIDANRDIIITALKNEQEALLAYFSHAFSERRVALGGFFDLLHQAAENNNSEQLTTALSGILGIIQKSPLDDLESFKRNMEKPGFQIVL